jgi:hypothetical protein
MRYRNVVVLALVVVAGSGVVGGCSFGPSTKAEVCESFDALDEQLLSGNGYFGNPLFHKAEDLADVAERYDGQPSLAGDAEALHRIADSDATNGAELMNATTSVARLCGHRLGGRLSGG